MSEQKPKCVTAQAIQNALRETGRLSKFNWAPPGVGKAMVGNDPQGFDVVTSQPR